MLFVNILFVAQRDTSVNMNIFEKQEYTIIFLPLNE